MRAQEVLRKYQKQIDAEGIEVGVSRQALDEVLDRITELENPWISVFGNPPKIGQWCWISDDGVVQREAWQWDASDDGDSIVYFWWCDERDPMPPKATQSWQPLPPPPEAI
ncbi:MAG: hypothetical protein GY922_03075 [Proteobacteria bacterium]|nr:hypothetical protein [Pseudomonadota bacterium]